jgi:ATP adenylyltransferase
MKNLWSPWRSKYIESFKEESSDKSCIFCDAADLDVADMNNLIVHRDDNTFALLNLYPYNNGHLMIVPYRHISDLDQLNDEELVEIMNKLKLFKNALAEVFKPQGFNVGLNLGRAGGAGIDEHLHFHIVPRWNGDTNFMPVFGEVKVISQEIMDTKKKLLKAIQDLLKK